ncbi:MAG: hypothetical protein AAB250_05820 [Bdellovibrionota bacterium]
MRDLKDLTRLFKLAMTVGLLTMVSSAAFAATNAGNAEALNEAAARARTEFASMNDGFQRQVRTRIVTEYDLRIEEPALDQTADEDSLLISAAGD